jgi:predicted alpha-1,2-mannosidase
VRDSIAGKNIGAFLTFPDTLQQLQLKVALSYTSLAGARANMRAELDHWDFERVRRESREEWNDMLGRIEVSGGTEQRTVKFYTDLWHALLGRRIVSDVDGSYIDNTGPDPVTRTSNNFPHYNFDAWWGSHWSLNQLWSLAYPEIMDGFCNTMVDMYRNGGLIPRGPSGGNYTYVMIGDPAVSFFAAAINKGITNYDVEAAYEGLRKNAFVGGIRDHAGYEHRTPAFGGGMPYYEERGYVPEGIPGPGGHKDGASMTLEYAYQDWCLAQIAKQLGKEEDYAFFLQRSQNYRKVWNPATGYMHPREMDGSWIKDFAPVVDDFNARGFCEANSAIYSHYVPHDLPGLMALYGGRETYVKRLNESFERAAEDWLKAADKQHAANWVDYGNQPGTGMAHLFNVAGAPELSQKWVRAVKDTYGETTPYGGYHGDEDQGQMGALGVLMAIGLFSVDGSAAMEPTYEITTPVFKKITINLHPDYYAGERFTISVEGEPEEEVYIKSASVDGMDWSSVSLPFERVSGGGELLLGVGEEPSEWGR